LFRFLPLEFRDIFLIFFLCLGFSLAVARLPCLALSSE